MTTIYALVHPVTGQAFYVGKCVTSLKVRLSGHTYKARSMRNKTPLGDWIRALQTEGKVPKIVALEESPKGRWQDAERLWIAKLKVEGAPLLNLHLGGNGAHTRAALKPEYAALLGKVSDARIAEQAGLCRETIAYHRRRAGIPASGDRSRLAGTFKKGQEPHNKIDLPQEAIALLGVTGDRQISETYKVPRPALRRKRLELGISSFKGRHVPRGIEHGMSKLTPEAVRDIRSSYVPRSKGRSLVHFAQKYGVDPSTVSDVVLFKIWKDIQ